MFEEFVNPFIDYLLVLSVALLLITSLLKIIFNKWESHVTFKVRSVNDKLEHILVYIIFLLATIKLAIYHKFPH